MDVAAVHLWVLPYLSQVYILSLHAICQDGTDPNLDLFRLDKWSEGSDLFLLLQGYTTECFELQRPANRLF